MQPPPVPVRLRHSLRRYFLAGLVVVVPVAVSLLAMTWFVTRLERLMGPPVEALTGLHVPGIGLVTLLAITLWAGWMASNLPGRILIDAAERVLLLIPGLNWMYRTTKQVADAFSPDSPLAFRNVVLVEYPRPGVRSFGFVTTELELEGDGDPEKMVAVYIPTNHFYIGDFRLFRKSEVRSTTLAVQDGIRIALSAGAAAPEKLKLT
jgi:uncharacterized membrane protein